MKIKGYLLSAVLLLGTLVLTGCFEEVSGPFDGEPRIAFAQVSGQYSVSALDGGGTVTLDVEFIAPQRSNPVQASFVVVDSLTSSGLEEGTNFSFPNGMTFTIPANSNLGQIEVQVPDNEFEAGSSRMLTLRLQESEDGEVTPAENWQDFTINIVAREAVVAADTMTVNFDTVAVGATVRDTVTISNSADATRPTEVSNVEITGDDAGQFDLVNPPGQSFTLQPGGSQAFIVEFAPDMAGDFEAELTLEATNIADASGLSVTLLGTAVDDDGDGDNGDGDDDGGDDGDDDDGNGGDGDGDDS